MITCLGFVSDRYGNICTAESTQLRSDSPKLLGDMATCELLLIYCDNVFTVDRRNVSPDDTPRTLPFGFRRVVNEEIITKKDGHWDLGSGQQLGRCVEYVE